MKRSSTVEETETKRSKTEGNFHRYFNEKYKDPEMKAKLKQQLLSETPFPFLQITDFIQDDELVKNLELQVPQREFSLKSNDLYDFYQSGDLNKCDTEGNEHIRTFRDIMVDQEFHSWLEDITEVKGIHSNIDMSAAIYQDGSYLQCHDDKLEGRRIAYIYYLVPEDWSDKEGGELSLFEVERTGVPKAEPAKKIIPKRNSLLIFIVSVDSFHRVEQLYSARGRMTISGWFRGPPKEYPEVNPVQNPFVQSLVSDSLQMNLNEWINPIYLEEDSQNQIQEQFEGESQISLHSFLLEEKFNQLRLYVEKIQSLKNWKVQSPPHQRYYLSYPLDDAKDSILGEFSLLIRSKEFFALLKKLTDLDVAKYFVEMQKFENGCFTLMHDGDCRRLQSALDCYFYIIDPALEWDEGWGGYSSYNDEEGELLTVTPCGNTLSLVYCDEGTSRFTKFLNYHVPIPLCNLYMLASETEESK